MRIKNSFVKESSDQSRTSLERRFVLALLAFGLPTLHGKEHPADYSW